MKTLGKTIYVTPDDIVKIILVIDKSFYAPESSIGIDHNEVIEADLPDLEEFTLYDVFLKYKDKPNLQEIFVVDDWPLQGKIYKIEKNGSACEYATTRGYA